MRKNIAFEKSLNFAVRIVGLSDYLQENRHDFVLSRQILKSGTSIGANLRESQNAQSADDFISKLSISLKEANETCYWLELLHLSGKITNEMYDSLNKDLSEIIAILVYRKATKPTNNLRSYFSFLIFHL